MTVGGGGAGKVHESNYITYNLNNLSFNTKQVHIIFRDFTLKENPQHEVINECFLIWVVSVWDFNSGD